MRLSVTLVCSLVLHCCCKCRGDDSASSNGNANVESAVLGDLRAALLKRSESHAVGCVEWSIERRLQEDLFGAKPDNKLERIRIVFDNGRFTLLSVSSPPEQVVQSSAQPIGRPFESLIAQSSHSFRTLIESKFSQQLDPRPPLPYRLLICDVGEVHLWGYGERNVCLAARCEAGSADDHFAAPIEYLLLRGFCYALRCDADSAADALSGQGVAGAEPCWIVERRKVINDVDILKRFWIEVDAPHRLRQFSLLRNGLLIDRADFEYASTDDALPGGMTLLRLLPTGVVRDELAVRREDSSATPLIWSGELPAGVIVSDYAAKLKYETDADGGRIAFEAPSNVEDPTQGMSFGGESWTLSAADLGKRFQEMLTWPYILIPMGVLLGGYLAFQAMLNVKRSRAERLGANVDCRANGNDE